MSDWAIALIAAGSALAGSAVTGWYARAAGIRQAEAARHAGDRQADALFDTVRMTLREQAAQRVLDLRRQTYLRFLEAADAAIVTARTSLPHPAADPTALPRALGAVTLEGPQEVADAARHFADRVRAHARPDDLEAAKHTFLTAASSALLPPPPRAGGRPPSGP
ncbi:hypothetical protein [Streptomyces sp.]|uniref:hypothetical protein n=1 Tax=Streptomyces sp. TaxID=1931 RepID=UPI002F41B24F